jgi:hypothetical protein
MRTWRRRLLAALAVTGLLLSALIVVSVIVALIHVEGLA